MIIEVRQLFSTCYYDRRTLNPRQKSLELRLYFENDLSAMIRYERRISYELNSIAESLLGVE